MTHSVYSKGRTSVVTDQEKVTVNTGFRTRTVAWSAIAEFMVQRETRRGTYGAGELIITRLCVRMRDGTVHRLARQISGSAGLYRTWVDDAAAQLNAIRREEIEREVNQGQENQGQENQGQENQGEENQGEENQGEENQGQDKLF